jgi:hypothetical protein
MSEITEALKKLAEQVRDERKAGANTAERVGSLLVSIIGAIQEPHNIPDLTGYATQSWVQDQKYLTEHQDLTIYKQHIEDNTKHLSAEQIEMINKISGKLDKSEFEELFEKKTVNGVTYIHAKFNLYSDYDITAGGIGGNATSGSSSTAISYNRLDKWADYSTDKAGYVLSALLGYDLHTRLNTIESDYATTAWVTSQKYLTTHQDLSAYATQAWVQNQKYLTAHQSIYALTIQGNGTALGTFTPNSAAKTINITYSNVGAAAASHSHTIAQITNLQTSLDAKLNKSVFDDLFEKVTENGVTYIHAKYNFYSDYDITAGGIGSNATSGSSSTAVSYNRLDKWADYSTDKAGYVLSALLGYDLHSRLNTIEGDYATTAWVTSQKYLTTHQDLSAYATQAWVQNQKYLTTHQSIYALTIQGNGTALGTYTPNSAAKTINITYSNVGAAAASHSHTIAQITNLQTSLDAKLNKSVFDDLFEKVTENGVTYIHAKYNFYSDYDITAGGIGSNATNGSSSAAISYNRLDQWADYTSDKAGYVLSALLGYDLHSRLTTIEGDYATQAWVTSQKYLTAHQSIYALTIQGNGTTLGTFTPNSAAKTINITYSNVGAAAASHTHTKSQITDFPTTWAWSALTSVPTTISGYGITDAYTKTQVDTIAAKYLLLDGSSFFNSEKYPKFYSSRISSSGGGWAMHQLVMYAADKSTEVYRLGIYGGNETLNYIFLGTGTYSASNNLRIYPSGTVTATTFSGALSGNASTATKLATARTIALSGAVTGSGTFDGSGNLTIATTHTATTISGYGITDAYTKTEVDTLAAKYLPLTGGTVTGATTFSGSVALNGTTTAKGITSSGVFKSTYAQALYGYVSSGWTYIRLQSGSTYYWDIATSTADSSNALQFRYKGSATSTNGMQLTTGGNLGIGCVSPTYKLQVAGTLYASGAATFASTLKIGSATLSWDEDTQSLKVDTNFYSEGEVTAGGSTADSGTTGGTAGISYDRLDAWSDYTTAKSGYVLSALLGYDLHTRLTTIEGDYATRSWVASQGYITSYVNTTYSAGTGLSLSGTTFSNAGVRSIATGTSNGTISVNTNGTTANVAVKGLGTAAYTASTAYAAASHTHSYLPLSGGTLTGALTGTTITATTFTGALSGNASTATKLATARTIALTGSVTGSGSFDGSGNLSITTTTNHTHSYITYSGTLTAISGTTKHGSGLYLYGVYNNGYPSTYGNVITVQGGGGGELLLGWQGSASLGRIYYRSLRDNTDSWSSWGTVAYTSDIPTKVSALTNDSGYITSSASITGNAATATTATKLGTATVGSASLPIYLNGGTATAVTASSLFSALANSGNNISITIAGQNRTLTPAYATNADTVDSWHLVEIIKSYYVHLGGSGLSNYWCKFWDCTFNSQQYNDADITFYIHSAYMEKWGIVMIRCRQQGANNQTSDTPSYNVYRQFYCLAGNLNISDFRMYYDDTTGKVELWANVAYQYGVYNIKVLSVTDRVGSERKSMYGTLYNVSQNTAPTAPSLSTYQILGYLTIHNSVNGNAATATKLATARTIALTGSVTGSGSFDGSGNLSITTTTNHTHSYLPLSGGTLTGALTGTTITATTFTGALSGNASTATKLATARTLWGQSFDGSANVSGSMTGVGNITMNNAAMITTNTTDTSDSRAWYGLTFSTTDTTYKRITLSSYFGLWYRTGGTSYPHVFTGGKVGINETSPAYQLHVTGTLGVSGATTLGSTLTVSGLITAQSDVHIPIAKSTQSVNSTYVTVPGAGALGDTGNPALSSIASLSTYKTFIGTMYTESTWYNVISVRHRNGYGDGSSYGMYIKALLTSTTGSLTWNQHANGTWGTTRTILDSGNYNSYSPNALANYYSSRPTSMDVQFSDGKLRTFLATSSCTTSKPTLGDAHIIHLAWDNSGGWDSEIAIGENSASNLQFMQYRCQLSGTWKSWATLLDSTNYSSYALPLSGGTVNGVVTISASTYAALIVKTTSVASWNEVADFYAPNNTTIGYRTGINLGLEGSSYNRAYLYFVNKGGKGSTSNYASIGLHSADDVLNVTATKRVGILTTEPTVALHVAGDTLSTGEVTAGSDIRHKSVTEYLPEIAPEKISAAPIFKFRWTDRDDDKIHIGTSAQYWQEILPEIVTGTDFLTLNYPVLATILAVQASRRIDRIEQRILVLEQENEQLKQEISKLKNV